MYKTILLNKILDYVQTKKLPYTKSGKALLINCPYCEASETTLSAQQITNTPNVNCFVCHKQFTLLDIIRKLEVGKAEATDEELFLYLKELLHVNVETKQEADNLEKILKFFEANEFDLVPIAKNAKNPIESGWTTKVHKKIAEWQQWIINGLNIGVKTGACSNITVIDVDQKEIPKELEPYLKDTLKQITNKGYHFFFKYEDMPKTRIEEYKTDIENNGGQVVIQPSVIDGIKRTFNFKPIQKMPEELKKLLLKKIKILPKKSTGDNVEEEIVSENFRLNMFQEGGRNSSLIKLGGIFRKALSGKQTGFVLHTLNNHNTNPLPYKEVDATVRKLEHYIQYDEDELAHDIIDYLKLAETASKAEIEIAILGKRATGEDKKRIDKTLVFLIKEEKITKKVREYKLLKSMEWTDTIVDVGVPIDFEIPYLNDYAYFNWGDLIIIGSQNKYGKTTLAMNVVKNLVKQGLKPYYIYSESGGRFAKTAWKLGMKDGDFWRLFCGDPEDITLEPNSVTIYDWVRPPEFSKTDKLFDTMVQKLEKAKGVMICFVQLKKENKWFAENMITQYPALACKYLYEEDGDGTHTKFDITEVRDAKSRGKSFVIPCEYNWETKEVVRRDIKSGEEE